MTAAVPHNHTKQPKNKTKIKINKLEKKNSLAPRRFENENRKKWKLHLQKRNCLCRKRLCLHCFACVFVVFVVAPLAVNLMADFLHFLVSASHTTPAERRFMPQNMHRTSGMRVCICVCVCVSLPVYYC